ncbi:coiled-coil domain-containing protein 86-like [Actinia tenebrosa]|uniref:Coiled-coil domain-containing protein 86 n=1 Tax=Actinia tenebrosa TaxID=6105 RepID=A0A6P8HKM5_ACTTE|nr:coiled-coil domain-containing protein 86-like [Actinia tenebrosa]
MADEKEQNSDKKNEPIKIPRGRPKSGRVWKSEKNKKSTIIKVKPLHSDWKKKQKDKLEKKLLKAYESELKDTATKQKEEKRKRQEENKKRREENERKSQIVQVIKDTSKIKKMKKKHLRQIETR